MAKRLFVVVAILGLSGVALTAQSNPSIQGVWRAAEVTITNPNTPPAGFGKGTHTNLQPALAIFTGRHFSYVTDTAEKPRPTVPVKTPGKLTCEEMETRWAPFAANAGTYELSGTTLTMRLIVAKNPSLQGKAFVRYTIRLDGNNLTMTQVETQTGKIEYPNTVKYVRVE